MNQFAQRWMALDIGKRAVMVLASSAVVLSVLWLGRMATAPGMSLLYAGMGPNQSGEVLLALDARGIQYEIRGESIYVATTERDRLRMSLAGEGLPSNSGKGYELLDSLNGFGTTSQMFDAAYWRAKEGELARTILSNPTVRQARVHIATPQASPFDRASHPTASVTVLARGGKISEQSANSFRFLVASAVRGLTAENVAIIDAASGHIVSATSEDQGLAADERAASLKRNVERLLSARVGPGNAVVEISVETISESESITERLIDPASRVAISTDLEEVSSNETNSGATGVTVASNLPDGDAANSDGKSQFQNTETREVTNFEISETMREIVRRPGAIKRISVAVLINATSEADAQKIDDAGLGDIRDLVASTIGFDEARGDQITIKAMPFEPAQLLGTPAGSGWFESLAFNPMQLVQVVIFAVVALVLGLFVVRPVLQAKPLPTASLPSPLPTEIAMRSSHSPQKDSAAESPGFLEAEVLSDHRLPPSENTEALNTGLPIVETPRETKGIKPSTPAEELRQLIEDRQADTVEILRSWIEDDTPTEVP